MKPYVYAIAVLFSTYFSYSQPIITAGNFPINSHAEIYTVSDNDLLNLNPGNSGANQTWDYSGVTLNDLTMYSLCCEEISPLSSYYAQFFPNADYSIGIYTIEGDNSTNFYTISNNQSELIGYYSLSANSETGIPYVGYLNNYSTFFEFPYTFNSQIDDICEYENGIPFTISNNYDGYGTLITPFATYHNVIRNKITRDNYAKYVWYNSNPFFEIMNIQYHWNDGILTYSTCEIRKNITFLHAKENKQKPFSVYPNPTSNILMVKLNEFQKDLSLKILDLLGNNIITYTNLSAISNEINIDNLSNGIYLVEIRDKNQRIVHTDKIVKTNN